MADDWAWRGQKVFPIQVTGGALYIMQGWQALWRQTHARVLPVLTHLAGRAQVIVIHPPLCDDADGTAWRQVLSAMVKAHVERFPEQGPNLLFPMTVDSA
jgi:hypothetical protein